MFIRKLSCTALVDHGDEEGFEAYDAQFDGATREVYHVFGVFSDKAALKAVDTDELAADCEQLEATKLRHGVYEVVALSF